MRKTILVLLTFLALMKAPDFLPYYKDYKVYDFATLPRIFDFQPRPDAFASLKWTGREIESVQGQGPLRLPEKSFDTFFTALRRAELKQEAGIARIVHYGDSPTTADLITADIRQMLQTQFGDAGHGFHLIAKPWAWYEHRGVTAEADGWTAGAANQPESPQDGLFGLGGATFEGPPGAWARFKFAQAPEEQVEVHGWRQPGGGRVSVFSGGMRLGELDTQAEKPQEAFATFTLPTGAKNVELRVTSGVVRLFGIQFVKPQPGVIYSSLGVNGAHVGMLAHSFREDHWSRILQHVKPDLVVLNYGTNESASMEFVDSSYEKTLRRAIERIKKALPKTSILVMSPMDRGERQMGGSIGTVPALRKVVSIQAKVAADTKVGFFNTFEAMGGEGTMGRWYLAEPRMVGADLIHPMPSGAKIVGNLFYKAVLDGYNRYKLKTLRANLGVQPGPAAGGKSATMKGSGEGTASSVPLPRAQ